MDSLNIENISSARENDSVPGTQLRGSLDEFESIFEDIVSAFDAPHLRETYSKFDKEVVKSIVLNAKYYDLNSLQGTLHV